VTASRATLLNRYLIHRRVWETLLWTSYWLIQATAGSLVAMMDIARNNLGFAPWEAITWEFSSCMVLLALVPALIVFERRFPLGFGTFRRNLPWHVVGSLVYSVVHVTSMVGLRKLVYALAGRFYDFGSWPQELAYEYLKDARTYASTFIVIFLYRLLLLRLQGEARLLAAPDSGPALESVERPERFLVRKLGSEFLVAARDIEWLEAAENYVNLHVRGHVYPLRSTMTSIEERLDPERFVRVHRRYIVNLDRLVRIEPLENGDARLHLDGGAVIPCSRRQRSALRDRVDAGRAAAARDTSAVEA
jgi:hypothetical protein